jgi:Nitrogen regulatory protein PII
MQEIIAVIRMNMINKTKEALLTEGYSSLNCAKVLGRGKKKVDFSLIEGMLTDSDITSPNLAESISESHRLIPKRMVSMVVADSEVKRAVEIIIDANSTGKPGDGKIFVLPVDDAIRIRTGETGELAI